MGFPRVEQFTSDGTTTYADLIGPIYPSSERVLVNGLLQPRDASAYSISASRKRVTFVAPQPNGAITVAYLEDDDEN